MESLRPLAPLAVLRAVELILVFLIGPTLYALADPGPGWLFPALWVWALVCLVLLILRPDFDRRRLGWGEAERGWWRPVLGRFFLLGGLLLVAVGVLAPETLFELPRERPVLWLIIMVGYPLVSVYAQEIVFRSFFFERYAILFRQPRVLRGASALLFGYVHIVFYNWIAILLCLLGGVLFARTFERTRSTLAVSLEHSLYGCLIFTLGIGRYFYGGDVGS